MAITNVSTPTGAAINAALAAAAYGDTIVLTNLVDIYTGMVTLPVKSGFTGSNHITIRSPTHASLPGVGRRALLSHAPFMASLQPAQVSSSQNESCIRTAVGAQGYIIECLNFWGSFNGSGVYVVFGISDQTQTLRAHQPNELILDRCIGRPKQYAWGQKRGVELHGKNLTLKNCHIEAASPSNTQDSACVWYLNGEGPYTIFNNEFLGGTYGVFSGGGDSSIKTIATVAASPAPTTTSMRVTVNAPVAGVANGGEVPFTNQTIAFTTRSGTFRQHSPMTTCTVINATTYDLTFPAAGDPAEVPTVGGDVRWGIVPADITIEHNWIHKPLVWKDTKVLDTPVTTVPSAGSGGSLAAGTYQVRVAATATSISSVLIASAASAAQPVTVGASGTITISWNAIPHATGYRVFVQSPDLTWRFKTVTGSTSTVYSVNGTAGAPTGGNTWAVKNLFEPKVGLRTTFIKNVCEHTWPSVDVGYAFWLKSVNQPTGHRTPFSEETDLVISRNIIRHCAGFILTSGCEHEAGTGAQQVRPKPMTNCQITDNLMYDSGTAWAQGRTGIFGCSFSNGPDQLTFDHNTVIHTMTGGVSLSASLPVESMLTDMVYTNNLHMKITYGWKGQAGSITTVQGTPAISAYTEGLYTWTNNALANASQNGAGGTEAYPVGANLFPTQSQFEAYFVDYAAHDFRLALGSAAIGAGTGGSNMGCDVEGILLDTETVISGITAPPVPLELSDAEFANGVVGQVYSQTATTTGGVTPYTWTLTSGALPAGTVLDATTGSVTGQLTTVGDYAFRITVTDDDLDTVFKDYTVSVAGVPGSALHRFYFPSTGVPDISPTFGEGWDRTTGALRRSLVGTKIGSAKVERSMTSTALSPQFHLGYQFISIPLAAQTISGSFMGVMGAYTNNAILNGTLAICVRIVDAAGIHKTYLTSGGNPVPAASVGVAVPPAFHSGSICRSRRFLDSADLENVPLTSYTCANTDRLVIEVGCRDVSTGTTVQGFIKIGDNSTDHALGDGIGTDLDPWIEFTHGFLEATVEVEELEFVTSSPLPDGQVGEAYTTTFSVTGGLGPPYTYALHAGELPDGLALTANGVLAGIPEDGTEGEYTFTIRAIDLTPATPIVGIMPFVLTIIEEDPEPVEEIVTTTFIRILIGGVDVSQYVAKGSVRWTEQLGSRSIGRVDVEVPIATGFTVEHGQPVFFKQGMTTLFGGRIHRPVRRMLGMSHIRYACEMVDFSEAFDRRIIAASYEIMTLREIVDDINTNFLDGEGITTEGVEEGPLIQKIIFNYVTVKTAFDELATLTQFATWVDFDRILYFHSRAAAYTCPEMTRETMFDVEVVKDVEQYRNVQYLRASQDLTSLRTETFAGDGERRTFTVDFPVGKIPTSITVDAVEKTIGIRGVETGRQWYWNKGVTEIGQDESEPVLTTANTLSVTYQGLFPIIVSGQLDGEIAERAAVEGTSGRYERRDDDHSIEDDDVAIDKVTAMLSRHGLIADTVTFKTHTPGMRAGRLAPITHAPLGLELSYLIETTSARMANPQRVEYEVRAVGGNATGAWQEFYLKLAAANAETGARDNEVLLLLRTSRHCVTTLDELTATTTIPLLYTVGSRVGYFQVVADGDLVTLLGFGPTAYHGTMAMTHRQALTGTVVTTTAGNLRLPAWFAMGLSSQWGVRPANRRGWSGGNGTTVFGSAVVTA